MKYLKLYNTMMEALQADNINIVSTCKQNKSLVRYFNYQDKNLRTEIPDLSNNSLDIYDHDSIPVILYKNNYKISIDTTNLVYHEFNDGLGILQFSMLLPNQLYDTPIKELYIPNNIQTIPSRMLQKCINLYYIRFPKIMDTIDWGSFGYCYGLKYIQLPRKLNKLINQAFWECKNLKTVIMPKILNNIGDSVFYLCINLQNIILSNTLNKIEDNTFAFCRSIKLTIPKYTILGWRFINLIENTSNNNTQVKFLSEYPRFTPMSVCFGRREDCFINTIIVPKGSLDVYIDYFKSDNNCNIEYNNILEEV